MGWWFSSKKEKERKRLLIQYEDGSKPPLVQMVRVGTQAGLLVVWPDAPDNFALNFAGDETVTVSELVHSRLVPHPHRKNWIPENPAHVVCTTTEASLGIFDIPQKSQQG